MRAGVHEIFPILVLSALAIAFAFIALDYMLSTTRSVDPGSLRLFYIGADNYLVHCNTKTLLVVQIFNQGTRDMTVYRAEIINHGTWIITRYSKTTVRPTPAQVCSLSLSETREGIPVEHGFNGWLIIEVPQSIAETLPTIGTIDFKLYIKAGYTYLGRAQIEQS